MNPFLPCSSTRSLLLIFLVAGSLGCKKNNGSTSPNNVVFSFNDSLQATGTIDIRPGFDFVGGPNCEFQFDRLGQYATGETVDIGLFAGYHCDLITSPLPYTTSAFSVTINVVPQPGQTVSYWYSNDTTAGSMNNSPGNLILTLTERDNNRVRGTVTGTIYRTNVGQNLIPGKFNCVFDLAIPLVKQ